MTKHFSPRQLDVVRFAREAASLDGSGALTGDVGADFPRLQDEACEPGGLSSLEWRVTGQQRAGADGAPVPWLHVEARAVLKLVCQRCLAAADVPLEVDRWFRFVADEATAAAQDDACDEDVLAWEPKPDVLELVEDELLMAVPLVPMHMQCPDAPPMSTGEEEFESALVQRPSAFAALAHIKPRN